MEFLPLGEDHIPNAVAVSGAALERERRHVPLLHAMPDALESAVTELVREGHGVAALEGGRLTGYLAFYESKLPQTVTDTTGRGAMIRPSPALPRRRRR